MNDSVPRDVLSQYPSFLGGTLTFLGNHGGFSGSALWKLETAAGALCLKAFPIDWRSIADLTWIHGLIARASAQPWMPRVMRTTDSATYVAHLGRLWELETWMPGGADFAKAPSEARLQSACKALAHLHNAWREKGPGVFSVCPAAIRRLESWRAWQQLLNDGWRPVFQQCDPYAAIAEPLWNNIVACADDVPRLLTPWLAAPVPVQPCICDLWHDHVLFTGDVVTGIIDFGSAKIDHVAVDLARLLGSLVGNDRARWDIGCTAYSKIRLLAETDRTLALDLHRTGTIIAATHWLRWLYHERRRYSHPDAVLDRLTSLLGSLNQRPTVKSFEPKKAIWYRRKRTGA